MASERDPMGAAVLGWAMSQFVTIYNETAKGTRMNEAVRDDWHETNESSPPPPPPPQAGKRGQV